MSDFYSLASYVQEQTAAGTGTTMSDISYLPTQVGVVQSALRGLKKVKKKWNLEILEGEKEYTVNVEDKLRITVLAEHWASFQAMLEGALDEKSCLDLSIILQEEVEEPEETKESILKDSKHSRDKCMACSSSPEVECLWAEGMGHVWFCMKHFKEWVTKGDGKGEICSVKKIQNGKASAKWKGNTSPNIENDFDFLKEGKDYLEKSILRERKEELRQCLAEKFETAPISVATSQLKKWKSLFGIQEDLTNAKLGASKRELQLATATESVDEDVATATDALQQKMKTQYADEGEKLSLSTWGEENTWYKFWILTDGTVIPVENSHGDTVRGAGVEYLKLLKTGALRGHINSETKEMSLGGRNITAQQRTKLIDLAYKYGVTSVYLGVKSIRSHGSSPVKSPEQLDYMLTYGYEASESKILISLTDKDKAINALTERLLSEHSEDLGKIEILINNLSEKRLDEVLDEKTLLGYRIKSVYKNVEMIFESRFNFPNPRWPKLIFSIAVKNNEIANRLQEAQPRLCRIENVFYPRAGQLAIENGVLESLKEILDSSEVVYGWVRPSGEIIDIGFGDHGEDAVQRMKRISGEDYPRTSGGHDQACLDLMKLKKYIRMFEIQETDELNVSVGGKVSSAQLSVIGRLARDYNAFYYDIINQETGKKDSGKGHREFIEALRTCDLLESVVAK